MSARTVLEVRNLSKSFPGVQALDDVRLDIREGEVHAVMGENGAGKSTLMKIVAGVYQADAGVIELDGAEVKIDNPLKARQLGINLIAQELNIAGNVSVAQNVFMGSEISRFGLVDFRAMERQTAEVLKTLGAPFTATQSAGTLSIAEQQQVEIARALVHKSKVLIMDEPTAALSEHETERLFSLVQSLRDRGIAIVYISHRINEVYRIADRVTVLRDGQYIGTLEREEISGERIVRMMVGRSLTDFYKREVAAEIRERYLVARDLRDKRGKVRGVSFQAAAGEILAIAGLVGSGRTELARLIFGADKADAGEISIDGRPVSIQSPTDAIAAGIGYVPEDRKSQGLFLEMSSHYNICMNVIGRTATGGVLSESANVAVSTAAIRKLNIRLASRNTRAVSLSGGNQQKLLLARWLEINPRVLILDEPTRGVDVGAKSEIYRIIGEIAKQGVAVIFISSELPEVVGIAQRVLVMREGQLVADLRDDSEITQEVIIGYATGVTEPQTVTA